MGFAYDLSPPIGHRAAFGLIALQSDETLEPEVTPMLSGDGLALYATRVPSAPEVTAETLATMEAGLAASAGLLPPSIDFDVVGYACTSGASVIGAAAVAAQVRRGVKTREVTNPMSALAAACAALWDQPDPLCSRLMLPMSRMHCGRHWPRMVWKLRCLALSTKPRRRAWRGWIRPRSLHLRLSWPGRAMCRG